MSLFVSVAFNGLALLRFGGLSLSSEVMGVGAHVYVHRCGFASDFARCRCGKVSWVGIDWMEWDASIKRLSNSRTNEWSNRLDSNNKFEQVDVNAVYRNAPPHVHDHKPYIERPQQPQRCTPTASATRMR